MKPGHKAFRDLREIQGPPDRKVKQEQLDCKVKLDLLERLGHKVSKGYKVILDLKGHKVLWD